MSAKRKLRRRYLKSLKTMDSVVFAWQAGRITKKERDTLLANKFGVRIVEQKKPSRKVNLDDIDREQIRTALDNIMAKK